MTGIDLFKALGGVKEEYIAEADGSRKLPHVRKVTLQWCAALAACVCLLLGWGFIAQHLSGIADYTGDETKVTGAAETAQADGADQGTAPTIGGKVVIPVRITAEAQPVSDVKVFTDEEKIGQIMPLLLLKNAAETSGDPNAYDGSANIFTLEYANGETSTITVTAICSIKRTTARGAIFRTNRPKSSKNSSAALGPTHKTVKFDKTGK